MLPNQITYHQLTPPRANARFRDRFAWRLANFILNNVATKEYRDNLSFFFEVVLATMAKVDEEQRQAK